MTNDPAFLSFVAAIANLREAYRVESKYNYVTNFGATFDVPAGAKFARVYSTETWEGRNANEKPMIKQQIYCFVALVDSETKGLGKVTKGDVMKPATYKAPARHARGNIYSADNGLATCNSYGPGYLR